MWRKFDFVDVAQLVMTLYAKTGVQVVESQEWQGLVTLQFSSAQDAQRAYDAMAAEEMSVSPPVEVNGQHSVSLTP